MGAGFKKAGAQCSTGLVSEPNQWGRNWPLFLLSCQYCSQLGFFNADFNWLGHWDKDGPTDTPHRGAYGHRTPLDRDK